MDQGLHSLSSTKKARPDHQDDGGGTWQGLQKETITI